MVSQGCRPIGRPLAVTRAEGNIIYELAGQPALHRLLQMAKDGMSERDVELINQGLHMGLVIDEHKVDFGRGDFLIRNVIGADRANGAIAIGDAVEVGTTVQFHVRDAEAADEDLRELLADRQADGGAPVHLQRPGLAAVRQARSRRRCHRRPAGRPARRGLLRRRRARAGRGAQLRAWLHGVDGPVRGAHACLPVPRRCLGGHCSRHGRHCSRHGRRPPAPSDAPPAEPAPPADEAPAGSAAPPSPT